MSEPLTNGDYDATVVTARLMKSSRKGTLGVEIDVNVDDRAGSEVAMRGYIWLTPSTIRREMGDDGEMHRGLAERQLNAIGYWEPITRATLEPMLGEPLPVRGNRVSVALKWETYEEKDRLKISFFNPPDTKASTHDLDALFGPAEEPPIQDNGGAGPAAEPQPAGLEAGAGAPVPAHIQVLRQEIAAVCEDIIRDKGEAGPAMIKRSVREAFGQDVDENHWRQSADAKTLSLFKANLEKDLAPAYDDDIPF